jgi:hypothetical protein
MRSSNALPEIGFLRNSWTPSRVENPPTLDMTAEHADWHVGNREHAGRANDPNEPGAVD